MKAHDMNTVTKKEKSKVTIKNRSGFLHLDFRLPDGTRKRKSLKLEDTQKNRKKVEKEIIPVLQTQIALGQYGKNLQKEDKQVKTFGFYSEFFLQEKSKLRSYHNRLGTYNKVIKFFKNKNVEEITRLDIKNYLLNQKVGNDAKSKYLSTIKCILEYAVDDRALDNNPAVGIKLPKSEDLKKEILYFKKDEISLLVNNASEPLKTYIQIGIQVGLRPQEILALNVDDISNGYVKVQRAKTRGKIGKLKTNSSYRTVPFDVDISNLTLDNEGFLFSNWSDVRSIKTVWENLLKKCNLEYRGISNTRHTFATHLLKDNIVSISELSGLLGHSKVNTTLSYYSSVIDSKDENVAYKLKNVGHVLGTK